MNVPQHRFFRRTTVSFLPVLLGLALSDSPGLAGSVGSADGSFMANVGAGGYVTCVATQTDGRILIGGSFNWVNGASRNGVARLNTDGSLDASFGPTDVTGSSAVLNPVERLAVLPDGKIAIGGFFQSVNGTNRNGIARLNNNGSLDLSFSPPSNVLLNSVGAIVPQPDGKVLFSGAFSRGGMNPPFIVMRLNVNGSLDTTFNAVGGITNTFGVSAFDLLRQSDGKILVVGDFTALNGMNLNCIARLTTNGAVDMSFNIGSGVSNSLGQSSAVYAIKQLADGRTILGGDFQFVNGTNRAGVARLFADGSLDPGFTPDANYAATRLLGIQSDGRIVLWGSYGSSLGTNAIRLSAIGTRDSSFAPNFVANGGAFQLECLQVQPDDSILVGGNIAVASGQARNLVARLNLNGTTDPAFDCVAAAAGRVSAMAQHANNKLLVGGSFTSVNGHRCNALARLHHDGSFDESFASGLGSDSFPKAISVQADGKILVAGQLSLLGLGSYSVLRFNTNGTHDSSFVLSNSTISFVNCLAVQNDGLIVVAGQGASSFGTNRAAVMRVNTQGAEDPMFDKGIILSGGSFPQVKALRLSQTGKILIGGNFLTVTGVSRRGVARLNEDGSLDMDFDAGTGLSGVFTDTINALAEQSDGKLIVAGYYTSFGGLACSSIARLGATGAVDNAFAPAVTGGAGKGTINALCLQGDGKILLGGLFDKVNGTNRAGVARLNTNGTLNVAFNPTNITSGLNALLLESDGNLLIGGFVQFLPSNAQPGIARLFGDLVLPPRFLSISNLSNGIVRLDVTNPAALPIVLQSVTNLAATNWQALATNSLATNQCQFLHTNSPPSTTRFYRTMLLEP